MYNLKQIKDANLRSVYLKENIIQQIYDANLPVVLIKYIVDDLSEQIDDQFYTYCSKVSQQQIQNEQKQSQD